MTNALLSARHLLLQLKYFIKTLAFLTTFSEQLMCADDLPDTTWTFYVNTDEKLGQWFDRLIERTRKDTMMNDKLYMKAISR